MEQQEKEEESGFVPDAYDRSTLTGLGTISRARVRWRMPAVAASMAVVAALCLHGASATHAMASKASGSSTITLQNSGSTSSHDIQLAGSTAINGLHGAINVYDGVGGGIEFWFDPNSGKITIGIGNGIGLGGSAVLGAYAVGSEPVSGQYLYANVSVQSALASTSVSGNYSISEGTFSGSATATVQGRSVTITSDGSTSFNVSVAANSLATESGWSGAVGIKTVFDFNVNDVIDWLLTPLKYVESLFVLVDVQSSPDYTGVQDNVVAQGGDAGSSGADGSADDDDATTTDDSSDSSSSDDSGDDDDGTENNGGECPDIGCSLA